MGDVAVAHVVHGERVLTFRRWATHKNAERGQRMRIWLTRKLADELDGVDVTGYAEGDVLDLPRHNAELLIAEGWARPCRRPERSPLRLSSSLDRAEAADAPCSEPRPQRRAEDRFRDELHDHRARTVKRDE